VICLRKFGGAFAKMKKPILLFDKERMGLKRVLYKLFIGWVPTWRA